MRAAVINLLIQGQLLRIGPNKNIRNLNGRTPELRDRLEQSTPARSLYKLIPFLRPPANRRINLKRSGIMKLRNLALALAFCMPLVSNSYARQIPKGESDPEAMIT